jgi:hypothetical protein
MDEGGNKNTSAMYPNMLDSMLGDSALNEKCPRQILTSISIMLLQSLFPL